MYCWDVNFEQCFSATIRVPSEQPTIQAGIDAAVDGDTVLVADGTYTGDGNRDIDLKGKAIIVTSENGAKTCIIDSQGKMDDQHRGFYINSGETDRSIIRGFWITGGYIGIEGGAGVFCGAFPTIMNCIISNNRTDYDGAGISLWGGAPKIINCIISSNNAQCGGGIYSSHSSPIITNCTFFGNVATEYGGGMWFAPEVPDCVPHPTIRNCILWGDTPDELCVGYSLISYSDIQGGYKWGLGILNSNPMFIGGNPIDLHLSALSPCIDSGTDYASPSRDLEGNPRSQNGSVDMGAFEFQGLPFFNKVYVRMPSHSFFPADKVSCTVSIWNVGNATPEETKLIVILDVFDRLYYAPSFSSFDYFEQSFQNGLTELTVISEFTWPSGVGSASGVVWYAALVNPEMTELVSEIGVFDFGWSE